jgi:flagellar hook-associated protein 2
MAATSVVSGLASGLNWRNIVDQIRKLETQKIDLIAQKKKEYGEKVSAWQGINKKLLSLKTQAEALNSNKGFNLYTVSLSSNTSTKAEDILSVTAGEDASPGSYQIVVQQLARAQKFSSRGFSSQTSSLNLSGDLLVNGKTVHLSSADTLLSLRDKINAVNTGTDPSGVSASIIHDGTTGYRLILTSDKEGSGGISLLNGGTEDLLGALGISEIQSGADALLSVDGISVTSSSNTVKEVIQGATLNLKRADVNTAVTVTVGRDYAGIKDKLKGLVNAFNEVIDAIYAQSSYDQEKQKAGGPLFGDSALRLIRSNLTQIILNKASGTQEAFSTLGQVGINLDNQGRLKTDDNKLQGYLETNFEDIKKLFSVDWSSTNSHLSYVYHTMDTRPGTYSVQITGVNPVSGYFVISGDATGTGEYLRGISGDAQGLLTRYSGTAAGSIGTLTLNFGVAELLNRSLYQMTDSLGGTISIKTDGIENTIRNMEGDIARMESRLDQRMAELERRFVSMETALSRLQSQTGWLTGQINSINRGWW